MNQINSQYKTPKMEHVKITESDGFDFSAAQHVSQFLRGEIVRKRREESRERKAFTEADSQVVRKEAHICTGKCENRTCNKDEV